MKLRTYLLLANCISIAFIIGFLLVSFQYMLVTKKQLVWLVTATIGSGIASAGLHFLLVRPLESSVRRMRDGAASIASGDLKARVTQQTRLAEFRDLAVQFNAMGASLDRSFAQVKAAERAQRELVANIAHDLRTPLASLQSYAEALEDGIVQDEESFGRYVSTIRSETIRLGELIQDVFDLSTLDADKAMNNPDAQSEAAVFEDSLVGLLSRFAPQLNAKSLHLRVLAPERSLAIRMSAVHLVRVLQNLIENAVRHSPEGGIIVVEAKELPERRIRICVTDEGAGIPPEERERIFERFYRVEKSRNRAGGGSGLGLSIAKLLVEQYGGEIGVEPATGQGSRFWFTVREA
ncbi:sensor histidine kinase [Cohnella panacarvi]|uniref:sensor histidine kinase n=1 Tax=Cohnella panacarvi TaxID=400776 RepID=UPI00047ED1A1|nr:ATP-binding protein [Cohnella panacarvi]